MNAGDPRIQAARNQRGNKMKTALVAPLTLLMLGTVAVGTANAEPKPLTTCAQVKAVAPYGIASNAKAASAAQIAGLVPPTVSASLYARAKRLDGKKPKGYVCGVTSVSLRQANATSFFAGTNSNDPTVILGGTPFAVAGSPAGKYLQYLARSTEAVNWSNYGSKGLVVPTSVAPTTVVTGDSITVTSGTDATTYAATFDPYGKLVTWTTTSGALADRLFAVQGTGSGYGIAIDMDWNYRTLRGQVVTTGHVTNTSGRPLMIDSGSYTGPDGVQYPGSAYSGCIANGQTLPITANTRSSTPPAATAKWQIEVVDCDYAATGYVDVQLAQRG